jgi:hypothetical protein
MTRTILCLMLSLPTCALAGPSTSDPDVRITNAHLVAACVDGKPVEAGERRWRGTESMSMTFTMRNAPRTGRPDAAPGYAAIAFTPERGHVYEIEVRSDPQLYSARVWPKGEWKPVVRDRTTNQIISSEPQWSDAAACGSR